MFAQWPGLSLACFWRIEKGQEGTQEEAQHLALGRLWGEQEIIKGQSCKTAEGASLPRWENLQTSFTWHLPATSGPSFPLVDTFWRCTPSQSPNAGELSTMKAIWSKDCRMPSCTRNCDMSLAIEFSTVFQGLHCYPHFSGDSETPMFIQGHIVHNGEAGILLQAREWRDLVLFRISTGELGQVLWSPWLGRCGLIVRERFSWENQGSWQRFSRCHPSPLSAPLSTLCRLNFPQAVSPLPWKMELVPDYLFHLR